MKKVLIITYYWPPAGGPGVQRVLKFVKYLPELGWQPLVLTVKKGEYPAIDETLAKNIPPECKVFKTNIFEPSDLYKRFLGMDVKAKIPTAVLADNNPGLKKQIANLIRLNFFIPDAKIGWKKFAVEDGLKIIETEKPDLIFSSSPPPTVHLIAKKLAAKTNLKWVADFRDPWTDIHYYEKQPRLFFAKYLDRKYERQVLDKADKVTCISRLDIELDFGKKTDVSKCVNIPNGYDEEDFSDIKLENTQTEQFTLLHLGAVNKERNPVKLFYAVKSLVEQEIINNNNFRIIFIGKVEQDIHDTIKKIGIMNVVEFINYLPHHKALSFAAEKATALLLLVTQSQKNRRILPGKTFEYMRFGKPVIVLGPEDGEVARIISETDTGIVIDYLNEDKIKDTLEKLLLQWKEKKTSYKSNMNKVEKYSRKKLTKQLVNVFEEIIK